MANDIGSVQLDGTEFDERHFRTVLGHFASGITVLAALVDGVPVGMTCQSFFSVSLHPPLVAFCVGRGSTTFPVLRTAAGLVVNVLDHGQADLGTVFARSGSDKWAGVEWRRGDVGGHPVLVGAHAVLECSIESEVDAGDHILVIARVDGLQARTDGEPLLFHRGSYRRLD